MARVPTLVVTAAPKLSPISPVRDLPSVPEQTNFIIGFDYGPLLTPTQKLDGAGVQVVVLSGTDDDFTDRIIGDSSIERSIATGYDAAMICIDFANPVGGVTYRIYCFAETEDGQTLPLWANLSCVPVVITGSQVVTDDTGNTLTDQGSEITSP